MIKAKCCCGYKGGRRLLFWCIPIVKAESEILDYFSYRKRKLWKVATCSHSMLEKPLLAQSGFQLSKGCFWKKRKTPLALRCQQKISFAFMAMPCPSLGMSAVVRVQPFPSPVLPPSHTERGNSVDLAVPQLGHSPSEQKQKLFLGCLFQCICTWLLVILLHQSAFPMLRIILQVTVRKLFPQEQAVWSPYPLRNTHTGPGSTGCALQTCHQSRYGRERTDNAKCLQEFEERKSQKKNLLRSVKCEENTFNSGAE